MRRRHRPRSPLRLMALGAIAVVVAVVSLFSIDIYSAPPPAPPAALDRVAEKNRRAAMLAAANMRAEAAASTRAAEALDRANSAGAP